MILLVPKIPFWPLSRLHKHKMEANYQFSILTNSSKFMLIFCSFFFRKSTLVVIIPAEVLTSMPLSASLLIIVAKLTHWSRWPSHSKPNKPTTFILDLSNFINKSWIFMLSKVLYAIKDFYGPIKLLCFFHISNIWSVSSLLSFNDPKNIQKDGFSKISWALCWLHFNWLKNRAVLFLMELACFDEVSFNIEKIIVSIF